MRFALHARTQQGDQTLAWSNDPATLITPLDQANGYVLKGSDYLVKRCERQVLLGRMVGGRGEEAGLNTPYVAFCTLQAVMREFGAVSGPIDFDGTDDEGEPLTFVAPPETDPIEERVKT